jgi:hypothetical protein
MGVGIFAKGFEFDDARLIADAPGDDLFGVFAIVGFDDCPATVDAIMATPFEVVKITGSMDLSDHSITVAGIVRGFDKVTVHKISPPGKYE